MLIHTTLGYLFTLLLTTLNHNQQRNKAKTVLSFFAHILKTPNRCAGDFGVFHAAKHKKASFRWLFEHIATVTSSALQPAFQAARQWQEAGAFPSILNTAFCIPLRVPPRSQYQRPARLQPPNTILPSSYGRNPPKSSGQCSERLYSRLSALLSGEILLLQLQFAFAYPLSITSKKRFRYGLNVWVNG